MAETIRIDDAAIARIERAESALKATSNAVSAQSIGQIASQFDAAVKLILANVEKVSAFAGLDPEETRQIKQGLETVEGGLAAGHKTLPYALSVGGPAGVALEAGAIALGALGGATRERARKAEARMALVDADEAFAERRREEGYQRDLEAYRAARRRARSIR